MSVMPDGNAIVYCDGAYLTPNGKTAHGLVRRTARYRVVAVVDSRFQGEDAGELLDGKPNGIAVLPDLESALARAQELGARATHFVMGIAPDGGRITAAMKAAVKVALEHGLNVDCGLHDFLSEDDELAALAREKGVTIRDVRKPPHRQDLHGFSGCIEQVGAYRVALLGTDSAVGKRTTAWLLRDGLVAAGHSAEMIGTGQTAWMQGVAYGIILDSLVNDFVAGEIEHAICRAWAEVRPDVMILEGQGSLLNPAYPGGHELIAAGRPHAIIVQHAPTRTEYDGFPGYAMHDLAVQIQALELISGRPVVAVAVNHEGLAPEAIDGVCQELEARYQLPCVAPLRHGVDRLVAAVVGPMNALAKGVEG